MLDQMASAVIGPTPGTVMKRRQTGVVFARALSSAVERLDPLDHARPHGKQACHQAGELGLGGQLVGDDLVRAFDEPARRLADDQAEGFQHAADLVLEVAAHPDQQGARRQLGAHDVAALGLDVHLAEPAGADQLGDAGSVVAVGLRQHHLQAGIGVARVHADHRQPERPELVPEPDR